MLILRLMINRTTQLVPPYFRQMSLFNTCFRIIRYRKDSSTVRLFHNPPSFHLCFIHFIRSIPHKTAKACKFFLQVLNYRLNSLRRTTQLFPLISLGLFLIPFLLLVNLSQTKQILLTHGF